MFSVTPIAYIRNSREVIEDDYWGNVVSTIELTSEFSEESVKGIEDFSHLEVIFYFNQVKDDNIQFDARHPRNNKEYPKVGIFAQRGKNRPNKLGLTTVEVLKREGKNIYIKGLDAINGTPVLDLKPVMKEFAPKGEIKQPYWVSDLMKEYWE
ncbi:MULTISPECIES: tRNA (N6-threonylcarbamoyladenosine(37)-N6)-methyltransferase TrmO [unclassified Paenibacillus]|uniref:tRNA (N6-threonylcarbamoyladenosine(37)-N6)-methyltransferase TrmO n=1 Tax=unclassified Paenibacillus TaxID=185978 RepID=UPI00070AEDDA|nr:MULTISPECIES: tRNA (N6-threonylcarbamoyladenosine(37)-N6)-methyltransferase TrmO [unclassified Paenibacillus]KQX68172.1 tRNA-Thr(GGU) m(6)t(6)A37 methyltransferase TsaA [Paenibacillus sp. Root444D2]KRE46473.1 tRNA-Thr(GGU) m(6)t(6)A37 methyltransferase TsaA [Paenibacillus sp. Soil724D2]